MADWSDIARQVRMLRSLKMREKGISRVLRMTIGELRIGLKELALLDGDDRAAMKRAQSDPAGSAAFNRREAARIAENYARANPPRRVLTDAERAQIAAENAAYTPVTMRVPARGVRGWSAAAAVSARSPKQKAQPT